MTLASISGAVFDVQASADEITEQLTALFIENDCDGLFLPAVNNLGVRLPFARVLSRLKASGRLRFAMLDAAQSFCHLQEPSPAKLADVTITGCHKWLRGALPLGIAVCRLPLVAGQLRAILRSPDSDDLDDPLLRFSEEVCDDSVKRLDKIDLLIVDELGYLSFSRSGAELLFQVFADRYERRSLLITSNLSFSDWDQIFQGERMTAALLDRLTHHCHIFEMNGESFRFKESMKEKNKPGKRA